jgi:hypothetical protein
MSSILTSGQFFASNPNNPKEGRDLPKRRDVPAKGTIVRGRRQQKLTQHLLSWPQGQKKDRMPHLTKRSY